jgi:hypothetical protein
MPSTEALIAALLSLTWPIKSLLIIWQSGRTASYRMLAPPTLRPILLLSLATNLTKNQIDKFKTQLWSNGVEKMATSLTLRLQHWKTYQLTMLSLKWPNQQSSVRAQVRAIFSNYLLPLGELEVPSSWSQAISIATLRLEEVVVQVERRRKDAVDIDIVMFLDFQ